MGDLGAGASLPDRERVRTGFQKALDSHGFGFQHAVQRFLSGLASEGPASWQFEAAELPVRVGSRETRIDFVFRSPRGLGYLVGECKRVHAGVEWCFIRGVEAAHRYDSRSLCVEALQQTQQGRVRAITIPFRQATNCADVGREVRSAKGDGGTSGRSSIEEAVTQVLTGVSGLSAMISAAGDRLSERPTPILPVIFTTARLWFSQRDLTSADLETGHLELDRAMFAEVPWIPLQYHQSTSLISEVHRETMLQTLGDQLVQLHRRAVFIVNVLGIREFLDWTLTNEA